MNYKDKELLDALVDSFCLKSYKLSALDEDGLFRTGRYRNREQLTLVFPNGTELILKTWCSGCSENTGFDFETK